MITRVADRAAMRLTVERAEHCELPPAPMSSAPAADPVALGRGLAVLRIFVGLIAFSDGLAKLFSFRELDIGP